MLAEPREHIRIDGLLAGFIQDLMAHARIEDERNIPHARVAIQLDRANDRFAVLAYRIFGARDEQQRQILGMRAATRGSTACATTPVSAAYPPTVNMTPQSGSSI